MFNVGGPEIMVILLVALVILGPEQLPKAMRTFGNVMAEIRKVSGGFQDEMRKAMDSIDDSSSSKAKATATTSSDDRTSLAQTPEEADVTEIVARNTSEPTEAAPGADAAAETTEVSDDRFPRIDPADRAAG